jgi:hypothetical protein
VKCVLFFIQGDKVHELSNLRVIMSDEFIIQDIYDHKTNEEISEELQLLIIDENDLNIIKNSQYIYFQVSRRLVEET